MINLNRLETALSKEDFLQTQHAAIQELQEKITKNEITVSVMGQFKRGKSSLINRLLGKKLLPSGIIPVTTIVTEIRYSPEFHAAVYFQDGRKEKIDISRIEEFSSEEKNPDNSKNVSLLKLYTPCHPFGNGIVLADTPGIGSVNKSNTDSSYSYIRKSDVILFLLSVDSPVSETERDFLVESKGFAQKFFFAVNKTDLISGDELKEFLDYCTHTVSGYLNAPIRMTAVSAKTGRKMDELKQEISRVCKENHSEILEKSVEHKANLIKKQAVAKLELQLNAASYPTEKLLQKLANVEEKQQEAGNLSDKLQLISQHKSAKLIDKIKNALNLKAHEIQNELEKYSRKLYEKHKNLSNSSFEKTFSGELNAYLLLQLKEMNSCGLKELETGYTQISDELQKKTLDTALFLKKLLLDELGINYPVTETEFSISEKSDFIMHIGMENTMLPDMNSLSFLLPRSLANKRYFKKALKQAFTDIERNQNNMLYNYRYKMQESLRSLCSELIKDNSRMEAELEDIKNQLKETLEMAENEKEETIAHVRQIIKLLE